MLEPAQPMGGGSAYSLDSPLRDRESGRGAGLLAEGEGPGSSLSQGHLLETAGVEVAGLKVGS